jgi:hypothetical protein
MIVYPLRYSLSTRIAQSMNNKYVYTSLHYNIRSRRSSIVLKLETSTTLTLEDHEARRTPTAVLRSIQQDVVACCSSSCGQSTRKKACSSWTRTGIMISSQHQNWCRSPPLPSPHLTTPHTIRFVLLEETRHSLFSTGSSLLAASEDVDYCNLS